MLICTVNLVGIGFIDKRIKTKLNLTHLLSKVERFFKQVLMIDSSLNELFQYHLFLNYLAMK